MCHVVTEFSSAIDQVAGVLIIVLSCFGSFLPPVIFIVKYALLGCRELLWTLSQEELRHLERLLCNLEQSVGNIKPTLANTCSTIKDDDSLNTSKANSSSSLFNDISNLPSDTTELGNASANRNESDNFQLTLMDVLASSVVESGERGNNNDIADENNSSDTDNNAHQYQPIPSTGIIINDTETGIARLIVNSTEQSTSAVGPRDTQRQHSYGSVSQQHSQFVFNLPQAARAPLNSDHSSDSSLDDPSLYSAGNVDRSPVPARVTVNRSTSLDLPATGVALPSRDPEQSDTDSSTTSLSCTDFESSSSSSEGTSPRLDRRGPLTQPLLDAKSQSLRGRYQNAQELLQKLFICISGRLKALVVFIPCDLHVCCHWMFVNKVCLISNMS